MSTIFSGKSVFPPAREHPQKTELVKIDEEYFLERWSFKDNAQREHYLRSALADFICKSQYCWFPLPSSVTHMHYSVSGWSIRKDGFGVQSIYIVLPLGRFT